MAMQPASAEIAVPSAQVVGNAFVEQYYHILHRSPELVYKFYQDSSVLSRPESDGTMTSVTTMQAINEKIQSFDYKNCKAEIKTADAQDSHQLGVVVLVTGCLTGLDNVRRDFAQTFFLAPQEKGYYVLNDVFRYIKDSEPSEVNPALANGAAEIPVTDPLTSDPEPGLAPDHSAIALETEDAQNGAEVCDPSDDEDGSVVEEEIVCEPPPKETEVEGTQIVSPDPPASPEEKKSYASIVKVSKAATRTVPMYVPTGTTKAAPANVNQQSRSSVKAIPEPQAPAPTVESAPESSIVHEDGFSIYVRNLSLNATPQQVEEEFRKFGPIKHDGVQVRSNKQGSCFGFVEFESAESMEDAIKASPVSIAGLQAVVEEKRTNTRAVGSGGRGRYAPGSGGGYRNDSFRGGRGGNYSGGRGYGPARPEFRNQGGDYSARPKGSYQRVDPSGSARFNRPGQAPNKSAPAT